MKNIQYKSFPRSRIATFDVYAAARMKNHIPILLECDVTDSRKKIRSLRQNGSNISFNGWMLHLIAATVSEYPEAAAYLRGKRKLILFSPVNISIVVEKQVNGSRVPIPLVIENAEGKNPEEITSEIEKARNDEFSGSDIVIGRKTRILENLYYGLPGFLRRSLWKYTLRHPRFAYKMMGNVMVTHPGMMGSIQGWFIHRSVHPISFGIGSIVKKPWLSGDDIQAREILHMTILIDHDVIDGAPMARFLQVLVKKLEKEEGLYG